MRIGVSGPAGAGKTTLVRALAKELSLPVIEEGLIELYTAQMAAQRIARAPDVPASDQRQALVGWMKAYFEWCEGREASYASHPAFIADRWELDIFGFWPHAFVQYDTWEDTGRLRDIFLRRAKMFDLIVMLPMGNFEAETHNEAGLRRQTSRNRSLLTQYSFTGMLAELPTSVATYVPLKGESLDRRVSDVVEIVRSR